jgi:E3 ubiquitin-protein ligase HUWE1
MFNPNYAIFQPSSTGNTYQPSPKSYINPHHLVLFKFVGRIVGKAMHDGFIMEAFFTPAFYKHILGLPITYRDM